MVKLKEKKNPKQQTNTAILWDWFFFFASVILKQLWNDNSVLRQIHSCLQSATGMFSVLPHKKSPHVTMMSALPNKKGLIPCGCTSAASISVRVMMISTAQLQPFTSNKICFGWSETDLDTEGEDRAYGRKSSEWFYQWQQEAVLPVRWPQNNQKENSKKLLRETGFQINSIIPQLLTLASLSARVDGTTNMTLGSALTCKYWWSKSLLVLEAPQCLFFMLTFTLTIAKSMLNTRPLCTTCAAPGLCWAS